MGNRIVTDALESLNKQKKFDHIPCKLDKLVLAAPDVDSAVFRIQRAEFVMRQMDRVTLYASEDDVALKKSVDVNGDTRLGLGGHKLTVQLASRTCCR